MVRIYKSGPAVQDGQKVVEHKANAVSTLGGSMSARFLTLFFALGFSALTIAADGDATRVRNVVLVHGAWADGSSWAKVIPLLEKAGLNVVAVQNPPPRPSMTWRPLNAPSRFRMAPAFSLGLL